MMRMMKIAALAFLLATSAASPALADRCDHELKAAITAIDSEAKTIEIGGVTVSVPDSADIEYSNGRNARFADLKVGSRIEVDAEFLNGRWVACEIDIKGSGRSLPVVGRAPSDEVEGRIESIDLEKGIVSIGGVSVQVHDKTRVEDSRDRRITLSDLKVGDKVEAKGRFNDDQVLIATKVEQ